MTDQPLRVVTYARYSTDMQSDASIEDQQRICHRLIADRGWSATNDYSDAAISGASLQRPGYQNLLEDARNGLFDVVVAESLDRISRDQEHISGFFKQMQYRGIRIVTVSQGDVSEMHIGINGVLSAMFLKDLAAKTHRGLEGRVRKGKSAGGISYGYRVRRAFNEDGTPVTGERDIDPDQAAVVERIFKEYDAGHSARTIAAGLNADGITTGTGKGAGTWGPSTIMGNWKRGTGILNNELYIGNLVWDRQHFIKDPEQQKRQARLNPSDQKVVVAVPHLQIIDDALWDRVKARQAAVRKDMNPAGIQNARTRPENARRPSYLCSGLLKCDCCGSSYTLINKTRYGCSGARNKGDTICSNRATITREAIEDRVLTGLHDSLLHPKLLEAFVEEYHRVFNQNAAGATAERGQARSDLAKIDKKINGIMTAIEDGMYQPSMKDRIAELEREKQSLESLLEQSPEPPTLRLHPSLSQAYQRKIRNLSSALQDPALKTEATEALRGLVSAIRMLPDETAPNGHRIELVGELAGILALGDAKTTKPASCAGLGSITMVAGARLDKYLPLYKTPTS
ncbi:MULTISPECIES: recombinase family protein [Pacificibacter]|uniref:recombinase family protein n=1 Tax=Pacificibacter TaxID=1042323 RepID=UPI001C08EB5B|nr:MULTISPECIES: recombinase family protein [Pacificibacter]MBU2935166.1 recombinase family protein [Pacificibacter marinus]MDO6615958.1 recombinase family protein [Pacificibacter sp. 1_MG-2023]